MEIGQTNIQDLADFQTMFIVGLLSQIEKNKTYEVLDKFLRSEDIHHYFKKDFVGLTQEVFKVALLKTNSELLEHKM